MIEAQYEPHAYPFNDLDHIVLDLPPQIAIVRCAIELERYRWTDPTELRRIQKRFRLRGFSSVHYYITLLYQHWTVAAPDWFLDLRADQRRPSGRDDPLAVEEVPVPPDTDTDTDTDSDEDLD